jgi:hypothetical protein
VDLNHFKTFLGTKLNRRVGNSVLYGKRLKLAHIITFQWEHERRQTVALIPLQTFSIIAFETFAIPPKPSKFLRLLKNLVFAKVELIVVF